MTKKKLFFEGNETILFFSILTNPVCNGKCYSLSRYSSISLFPGSYISECQHVYESPICEGVQRCPWSILENYRMVTISFV